MIGRLRARRARHATPAPDREARYAEGRARARWDFFSLGCGVVALRRLEEPPAPPDVTDERERAAWLTGYRMEVVDIELFLSLPEEERMERRVAVLIDADQAVSLEGDRLGGLMAFGAGRGLDRAGRVEDVE